MCCQIPLFARERCAVRHPGSCQFELFTVHVLPHCRCELKIDMRCSDKADMRFVSCKLKGHMHGWNLSGCLEYKSVSFAACDRHCLFHEILFRCVDNFVSSKTFRKFKSLITDVENYNFLGSEDLAPLHCEHSDRSAAEYCNILSALIIILEHSVDRYSCRLKHGRLFIRNARIIYNCILLWDHYIIGIGSLLSGTNKTVMFAQREVSVLTVITFHTWFQRCTGYVISNLNLCYTFTYFYNIS